MHLQYITPDTHSALLSCPAGAYASAVALAAAFAVTVPTAAVDDIDAYMLGATEKAIARVVGIFNEARPVDTDAVIKVATQAYKARYEVAHGLMLEKVGGFAANSPLDLFGIGFCLSPEVTTQLCENTAAIVPVLASCVKAARQIAANPESDAL